MLEKTVHVQGGQYDFFKGGGGTKHITLRKILTVFKHNLELP